MVFAVQITAPFDLCTDDLFYRIHTSSGWDMIRLFFTLRQLGYTEGRKHDYKAYHLPRLLAGRKLKEMRILPVQGVRYFKVQYCYEEAVQSLRLNRDNALAVDIGVDNLATCASNTGTPFIMDGRKLKSINRNYNKRIAKLQSIADKQGFIQTNLMCDITENRNRQVRDYIKR